MHIKETATYLYKRGMTLLPSPLRPKVPARDHLLFWKPYAVSPALNSLTEADIVQIEAVTLYAWALATIALYRLGLLAFHMFCDRKNIPDKKQAPVSSEILELFLVTLAGSYATTTISNYHAAVSTWHPLHHLDWLINKNQVQLLKEGVEHLVPASSKQPPREPYIRKKSSYCGA